ncbi:DUF3987 domain-containing protein [Pontibacter sp. BT310]|nr:DUF3987 domain-containing protein [Pontibacter sp. BT310]
MTIGGFLDNIHGIYQGDRMHPNLNCFITAPAGNGKSAFKYARYYGKLVHELLLEESKQQAKEYVSSKLKGKNGSSEKEGSGHDPLAPPFKVGFIPGDITSAALLRILDENGGKGVIFETEADSLSNNLGKDFGGHDSIFRKVFQHEPVSVTRKSGEFREIDRPRLSIAVSGTPAQILSLIPSAENGLFSRFIMYGFGQKPVWKKLAGQKGKVDLVDHFEELANEGLALVRFSQEYPTEFSLSPEQEQKFDEFFEKHLHETVADFGEDIQGVVFRQGLMAFRLAMILTAIRKFEACDTSEKVVCADVDFDTALALIETYRKHSAYFYSKLADVTPINYKGALELLKHLPDKFRRYEAVAIAEKNKISESSCGNYLKKLLDTKHLDHSGYGSYVKIKG